VNTGEIGWDRLVELMAVNPREILRVERVALDAGSTADLTVIDPELEWTVSVSDFESKARNCGFIGAEIKGRPTDAFVGGVPTLEDCVVR